MSTALVAVAVFRVVTWVVAAVAGHITGSFHPADLLGHPLDRWDAEWWGSIAGNGYGALHRGIFTDAAFAPAYPMAMRAVMWLVHAGPLPAGFLLSGASLLVAVAVIHRLVEEDFGGDAAIVAVLLLLLWPTAVFLAAPYSEPFSLAIVSLAILAARREHWTWAGLLAAAAMLSKYVLVVLVGALLIAYVVQQRRRGIRPRPRLLAAIALPSALALAGVVLFMRARYGDGFAFLSTEGDAWGHHLATPLDLARNSYHEVTTLWQLGGLGPLRTILLDAATILGLVVLAVVMLVSCRRHPAELGLVALVAAALVSVSGVDSAGRYALVVAPVFMVLGARLAGHAAWRITVLGASAALMSLQLVTFATGGWAG